MNQLIVDKEFKELIPPLSADEFSQLEENILRDGIQDPLKVWEGTLIDGHNRYKIARKHGLEFPITPMFFKTRDDVKIWIIKNQFGRRNLSAYDRSLLALKLKPFFAKKAKENMLATQNNHTAEKLRKAKGAAVKISCQQVNNDTELDNESDELFKITQEPEYWTETDTETGTVWAHYVDENGVEEEPYIVGSKSKRENKTNYQVAKTAGVSEDTIRKVEKIEQSATPEIKAALKSGDLSVNAAYKKVQKQEKESERLERKQFELAAEMPADVCKLFQADIRDGLPQIADNSIDFIITDPPYPKEYLPLYSDLSKVAARILKDGGSLVCMCGQSYLPDVIAELSKSMSYHWCMCYLTPGQTPQLWQKRTNTFWKPLLWFVKGTYNGDWIGNDVMQSPANDKHFHEWGQSIGGMSDIVERFTNPNETIFDPFVGGGTTGVAAVIKGRKFVGADINENCLSTTEQRIKEAYGKCVK